MELSEEDAGLPATDMRRMLEVGDLKPKVSYVPYYWAKDRWWRVHILADDYREAKEWGTKYFPHNDILVVRTEISIVGVGERGSGGGKRWCDRVRESGKRTDVTAEPACDTYRVEAYHTGIKWWFPVGDFGTRAEAEKYVGSPTPTGEKDAWDVQRVPNHAAHTDRGNRTESDFHRMRKMKNIEKYPDTVSALEAYNTWLKNVGLGNGAPFDGWLEFECEEPPPMTLLEAALDVTRAWDAREKLCDPSYVDLMMKELSVAVKREQSKPLRNCDVMTAEEMNEAHRNYCKSQGYSCSYCPLADHERGRRGPCELAFALAPYEGGAK